MTSPRRSFLWLLPLGLALLLFSLLARALQAGEPRTLARSAPSALLMQPAPALDLPPLDPAATLRPAQLRGQVWVLNVWASWCAPCRTELPALRALGEQARVPLVGLNYKDSAPQGLAWLRQHGNPFQLNLADAQGQVALDWGVVAVPETFVVDAQGRVRFKHSGPLTAEQVQRELLPLIERLRHAG